MNLDALKQNFRGEIITQLAGREQYKHDASIFEATPELVVKPVDRRDLEALVHFVAAEKQAGHNLSLTARAGGTDMTGGAVSESIIVDFTAHLHQIGGVKFGNEPGLLQTKTDHSPRITTEMGAYYRDLAKITARQHLMLPSFPASKDLCCLGGMVANNSGGEKSLAYGQTIDWVDSLDAVLSDGRSYHFQPLSQSELDVKLTQTDFEGNLYRKLSHLISHNKAIIDRAAPTTSKNSSGYYLWKVWDEKYFDLSKLLIGSQGTLGLISQATFRLTEILPHRAMLIVSLNRLDHLGEIVKRLKTKQPESLELFDDHTLRLALKFLPSIAQAMHTSSLGLAITFLPEVLSLLRGRLPKILILAEFAATTQDKALQMASQTAELLPGLGAMCRLTNSEADMNKYMTVRHESFNLLRHHAGGRVSSPFIEDICVHSDDLSAFLPQLQNILAKYPSFIYTIAGHAGDANFHIIPFVDLKSQSQREMLGRLSKEVYQLVISFHGTITAEHNDGLVRGPYMEMMFGPKMMELFRQVKRIFDPLDIFNPGKKAEGTLANFNRLMRKD